jgi:glycosyltransferase involved in cell wall biosynthesis
MKLLYLITRAERGGAQVHLRDLLRGFSHLYDISLGTGEEGYLCDVAHGLNIPVYRIRNLVHPIHGIKDLRAVGEVIQLIRRLKPDLIHAHTSKAGLIARLAGFVTNVPVIFTAHTWSFSACFSWKQQVISVPLERLAARLSGTIIAVSRANHDLALRHSISHPRKLVTIWNGIDDTPYRAEPSSNVCPRIVMVARFVAQKDQSLLVRALQEVSHPFHLVFVGDGPNRAAVEQEARSLAGRVSFLGDRDDVAKILSSAHISALISKWEGLPLSILEAMRAGLPVIASDVGGVSEAITDQENGFLTPLEDMARLRQRLTELILDPRLRGRLGAEGRRRYESDFALQTMLARTATVYREALSSHFSGSIQHDSIQPLRGESNETLT